ncbi:fatty acid desaturase [Hyphococcus flavus]|uniref:Fatty acid desaturase n=1 Tax=Hyphococcus flavus TaxID=1866326 RepID=A0AAE9ZLJ8_9PROT|nr:fatty acid desaturase [Hyphococcus flavus]WDI32925.1 fatty acid desaturase [Hyphococcus flavus]
MSSKANAEAFAAPADDRVSTPAETARAAMLRRIVEHCKKFQGVDLKRSILQASLSLALYIAAVGAMLAAAASGVWLAVALIAPFAAGLLVKLFTIQHDCGHGSYFETKRANTLLGFAISVLTFTPYGFWRDAHNRHHASSGDLDRRGVGGVDTLTVEEFRALSPAKKIMYKLYRHPLVMIIFGAPLYFLLLQRLPLAGAMPFAETYQGMKLSQIWKSVVALNIALVVFYGGLSFFLGAGVVAAVIIPVVTISAWIGTWLFFVQHQYEDAYWARKPKWNFAEAAIFGSSHYKLPQPLRWITGNIGLHHIHHLTSRIPNYKLMECYRASEDLLALPVMTIRESIRCARLALWCPVQQRMVTFAAAR